MTFEQAFKKIKTKFDNVDASKLQDMALQITLSDEDCGGTLYAAVKNSALEVEPYDYKDNDAVIDITKVSLTSILDGKASVDAEIEKGALSVKGDFDKFSAFAAAVKPAPKKVAAKKTTTKKAVAPKKAATPKKAEEKKTAVKTEAKKTTAAKAPAKTEAKKSEVKAAATKTANKAETKTEAKKTTAKTTK